MLVYPYRGIPWGPGLQPVWARLASWLGRLCQYAWRQQACWLYKSIASRASSASAYTWVPSILILTQFFVASTFLVLGFKRWSGRTRLIHFSHYPRAITESAWGQTLDLLNSAMSAVQDCHMHVQSCLGPVVSATCAIILMHKVMRGICCLNALPWQISGCKSLHSCCRVPASWGGSFGPRTSMRSVDIA